MAKRAKRTGVKRTKSASRTSRQGARRSAKSWAKKRQLSRRSTLRTSQRRPKSHRPRLKSALSGAKSSSNRKKAAPRKPGKVPRLDRARRTLDEVVPMPPSSLNLDRHGSAARTGRAELGSRLHEHPGMTPAITGGDIDADWENAYFSGDEAPGGDNPTPDQEVVDDIGKSLGVQYDDAEELKSSDKVVERDKHRWELDPASSEDYKDRK